MNQHQDPDRKLNEAWRHLGRVVRAEIRKRALPLLFIAIILVFAAALSQGFNARSSVVGIVGWAGCPPAATCG